MAERGVADVMAKGNGLYQIFVKPQGPGNSAGNFRDFQGMGKTSAGMISGGRQKDLSLVL